MSALLDWLSENAGKFGEVIGNGFNAVENLFVVTTETGTELTFFAQALGLGVLASIITLAIRAILRAINRARVSV